MKQRDPMNWYHPTYDPPAFPIEPTPEPAPEPEPIAKKTTTRKKKAVSSE